MPSQRRVLAGGAFTILLGFVGYFGQGHVHVGGATTKNPVKADVASTTKIVAHAEAEQGSNHPAIENSAPAEESDPQYSNEPKSGRKSNPSSPINLNSATASELQGLPGIGPSLSQRIVDYRTDNGPFKSIDDLHNVSGIGNKLFDKISPWVGL